MPSVRSPSCHVTTGATVRALVAAGLCLQAGCATMKTPTWPWSKNNDADKKLAGELGEDGDSSVISSEFNPTEQEFGWDYFKGENIKIGRAHV